MRTTLPEILQLLYIRTFAVNTFDQSLELVGIGEDEFAYNIADEMLDCMSLA